MHAQRLPAAPIQITGPVSSIEKLLNFEIMQDARRCDLHGLVWIEMHEIRDEQAALAVTLGCEVHCSHISQRSQN